MIPAPQDKETIFCQEYVRSGDALAALIIADITHLGDPTVNHSRLYIAQKILERPEIQAAINALRQIAQNVEQVEITQRSISTDMEAVYKGAFEKGDFKTCVSAKTLQANILGLLEQKISITSRKSVKDMTDEEIMAMLDRKGKVINVTPTNGTSTDNVTPNGPVPGTDDGGTGGGTDGAPPGSGKPA